MAFLKSCSCKLCNKINKVISQRVLGTDEVSEMAIHVLGIMNAEIVDDKPDNVRAVCAQCHAEVDARRAETREKLGLPILCKECAQANTKEYVGADLHGELVKTNNPNSHGYVKTYHKGSHAIQG